MDEAVFYCTCCILLYVFPLLCVSARRLEIYEEEANGAGGPSVTLRSGCSGKSRSCRSLSCTRSSVSLHTLTAESEEDEQASSHVPNKTSAFLNRMVHTRLTALCSQSHFSSDLVQQLFSDESSRALVIMPVKKMKSRTYWCIQGSYYSM